MPLRFDILHRSTTTRARLGRVATPHGVFDTPAFMPVGTRGSVKGLLPGMVAQIGAQIILGNTYHLLLRPGPDLIERLGGLQKFTGWNGPMLTDSGGYQAFSLAHTNKIDDDGVTFKSIVDGSLVTITPESAMQIQNKLGADIIMAFDDCPPSVIEEHPRRTLGEQEWEVEGSAPAPGRAEPRARARGSVDRIRIANERTVRWLKRCAAEHARLGGHEKRSLFGIVQGGTDLVARSWSAERVAGIDLPGYAIGGVAVGEGSADIARVVEHTAPLLPDAKPRYLMGVGYERDLLAAVRAGVDMFDCVLPTRNGRNANAFTPNGQIRLRNAKYSDDPLPIEPGCDCPSCAPSPEFPWASRGDSPFSRAYIRHLFFAEEMLGPILVSLHNLRYFQRFMADLRQTIRSEDWNGFLTRWPAARPVSGA
ncbi:MAG TPA: tRNA guanosine(34) transglycosylase Tgt [Phycisphaerales bacterium]|nr:tRNA guanosine(34) transglycosylase Tgt [Phycisphaerales bacterium]